MFVVGRIRATEGAHTALVGRDLRNQWTESEFLIASGVIPSGAA